MKLIRLREDMLPLVYLMRHWNRWYYVDVAGKYMSLKDFEEVMKRLEEQNDKA